MLMSKEQPEWDQLTPSVGRFLLMLCFSGQVVWSLSQENWLKIRALNNLGLVEPINFSRLRRNLDHLTVSPAGRAVAEYFNWSPHPALFSPNTDRETEANGVPWRQYVGRMREHLSR